MYLIVMPSSFVDDIDPQSFLVNNHFCLKHLSKCLGISFDFFYFRIIIYSPVETKN